MVKKWIAGMAALAVFAAAGAAAAENAGKVDFDQGVDVDSVINAAQAGSQGSAYSQQNSQSSQPDQGGQADQPKLTFTVGAHKVHAKGFLHKDQSGADWRSLAAVESVNIPGTMDLRPKLTQIEDQEQCGACWAFSLTATNRDGHAVAGDDPGRLSQEWLIDNSPEAQGCNGGDFDSAADFVSPKGQPLWSACAYDQGSGKCAANLTPAASITSWHMLGDPKKGPSVQDIETYITQSGRPISIAIAAGSGKWEDYTGGIYNGCTTGQLDHMINIVGWDNQGAKFDKTGNLPPGKGVWILRNSWGTSWGEAGYMRTVMTDSKGNRCNEVAEEAAYFDFAQ